MLDITTVHCVIFINTTRLPTHQSAGIGRTGTYLSLDYLADQAEAEGYVNVFQCVQDLRHQRVNSIQNVVWDSVTLHLLCCGKS